ncbi:acyl-CoA/acyl-ACP dehydrogenase [Calidifontibacter sp. DB0510]|uniref:Acyl-CoA/acyl-ACP dehydrogenase n=1 Tax=Metallococcus carri TaxID=1656884 RepID=A0A967B250_9MICO|nr:acyl-CoA dehydrogenase family protein [Metallococcus carri]NHN56589.1 acyl-CoA/acyl-ACP dehydrogenase [Metallococcus carri]NOP38888.1 acyl-CoA/acyl-ACP dehydrogenase [Calidifontibacter sp. DB2511S]
MSVDAAERTAQVGQIATVAAEHADAVDADNRFPAEAIAVARDSGFLAALIPVEEGGLGLSLREVAEVVRAVGASCSSTAMVLAMHHSQLEILVKHGDTDTLRALRRDVAERGLLIASCTTEINLGGAHASSSCAVEVSGDRATLTKTAPVISYGEEADVIFSTARRSPDAEANDQSLVASRKDETTLERTTTWNALGMRGTCSHGFQLQAEVPADAVFPTPYGDIHTVTMVPGAHILWASAWHGIARGAAAKARSFVQKAARRSPGSTPPGALRLAELEVALQSMGGLIDGALRRYETETSEAADRSVGFTVAMNTLKVGASQHLLDCVSKAMVIVGIAGYVNGTPFSIGRPYRDAMAPLVMVNNDRILSTNAGLELLMRGQA